MISVADMYMGSNKVRVMTMRRRRVILGRVFAAFDGSGECVFFRNTMFSQDCASTQKVVFSLLFFSTCVLFAYFEGEVECFWFVYTGALVRRRRVAGTWDL